MLESLLSWPVLIGSVAVLLIGVGFSIMSVSPPEYIGARVCFGAAYFLITVRLFWWATMEKPTGTDVVTAVLVVAGIGVLWATADRWVVVRQANDPDIVRRRQRQTLTTYSLEGSQVRQMYQSTEIVPWAAKEEWETKVFIYLKDNLGVEYSAQFIRRPDPTRQLWNTHPPEMPEDNYKMIVVIDMRLAQLDAIIKILMG
jgi:hypothetical protein